MQDTLIHVTYRANFFLAHKVPNFDSLAVVDNVSIDGKVSIYEPHFILEHLGNTDDHVFDVRTQRTDARALSSRREPHFDAYKLVVVQQFDVYGKMFECVGERSILSLHGDYTRLDTDLY